MNEIRQETKPFSFHRQSGNTSGCSRICKASTEGRNGRRFSNHIKVTNQPPNPSPIASGATIVLRTCGLIAHGYPGLPADVHPLQGHP